MGTTRSVARRVGRVRILDSRRPVVWNASCIGKRGMAGSAASSFAGGTSATVCHRGARTNVRLRVEGFDGTFSSTSC